MKYILVTGAAGFIGSHLCEALLSWEDFLGFRVVGLDNFDPFYDRRIKEQNLSRIMGEDRFELVEGFSGNRTLIQDMFDRYQFEAVVHLAARAGVGASIREPLEYEKLNIHGTNALMNVAAQRKVKNFIFASSSSVYGEGSKTPFAETETCLRTLSPYAATKRACEILAWNVHHLTQMPMTLLRFFTVYGPRQRPEMAIAKFTSKILKGENITIYGDGSMRRDFTYVEDIVNALKNAISWNWGEPHFEIFNLGNSRTTSVAELVYLIEDLTNKKAVIENVDTPPGEMEITCADISKSKELLAYDPQTPIESGLEKYVSWVMKGNN